MRYHKLLKVHEHKLKESKKLETQIVSIANWAKERYGLHHGEFTAEMGTVEDDVLRSLVSIVFFYKTNVSIEFPPNEYGLKL